MTHTLAFAILSCVLVTAGVTDCVAGKVYNWLTYPAMLAGLAYWAVAGLMGAEHGLAAALLGLLAGLVPFVVIYLGGGLGGGDVKLMGAVGALSASWACVLSTTVYALLIAVVMAAVVIVRRGIVRQTLGRLFGAALLTVGRVKPTFSDDSPRLPFSAAIAAGGLIAAAETLLGWQSPWHWLGP